MWKFPEEKRIELNKIAERRICECKNCNLEYEAYMNANENFPDGCPVCKSKKNQWILKV